MLGNLNTAVGYTVVLYMAVGYMAVGCCPRVYGHCHRGREVIAQMQYESQLFAGNSTKKKEKKLFNLWQTDKVQKVQRRPSASELT
jgi:hypothetical protein